LRDQFPYILLNKPKGPVETGPFYAVVVNDVLSMLNRFTMKSALLILFTLWFTKQGLCQGNAFVNDFQVKPALVWTFQTNKPIFSSPTISDDKLVITSTDGAVYCFKRQ
jgi:PQQ-like domain